jgi:hypothetical protein
MARGSARELQSGYAGRASQGLSVGSLLLFDLGYFSFGFFDTLTQCKLWWVSRYRENTSYRIVHVFYRQREESVQT